MKFKKIICIALVISTVFLCVTVTAAEKSTYDVLSEQEPVYVRELTLSELEEYYTNATSDEILDPAECNYLYGELSIGGIAEFWHVYMRTFILKEVSDYTVYDLESLAKRILAFVRASVADKYIRCIARTYNVRMSKVIQGADGAVNSITFKVFIACGEKTEDRQALKEGYIADIVNELAPLSDGERFIRLNEIMLDGRFKYDVAYDHRCSSVALVNEGVGVCEEYAGFTSLVLDGLGYENKIIVGELSGGVPHMWNLVTVNGRVYHLDILHDGPINDEGVHTSVNRKYLLVSEATVTETHKISEQYIDLSAPAQYDYVFEGYPESIEGAFEYNDEKYVYAEKQNMTAAELLEQLDSAGFMTVTKAGEALEEDGAVGSGCTVELEVNGVTLDKCTLIVKGDVNGDGQVGALDVELITEQLLAEGAETTDMFLLTADLDGNGAVTVTDLITAFDVSRAEDEPDVPPEPEGGDTTEPVGEVTE